MTSIKSVPQLETESLAFFEPDREIYGVVGPNVSVMFSGKDDKQKLGYSIGDDQQITMMNASEWTAKMQSINGSFELQWNSGGVGASLDSSQVQVCRVSGELAEHGKRERKFQSGGVATLPSRKPGPPVIRSIVALFENGDAFFMNAHKPAVYHGHGDERNDAALVEEDSPLEIADTRLSTVYSKDDLHTQAALEIWLQNDELPRRINGEAIAGTHVELTDRDVALAFYRWTMGSKMGVGYYEIALAAPPRRAA